MNFNLPIYYLNLNNRTDRRDSMESQFQRWAITDYTRVSVDKYFYKDYDDWKHKLITLYPPEKYDHPRNISITLNQFDTLIDWYYSNKSEYCIIMEDDLCLDTIEYWNFDWDYLMENLPCNWDCIQLYVASFNKLNLNLSRRHVGCHGSACYMVTRHYVEKLMKMFCYEDKYIINYNYGYDGGSKWHSIPECQPTSPDFVPYNIGVTYTFPLFNVKADLKVAQDNESVNAADTICSEIILDWWKNHSEYYGRDKLFSHTGGIFVDIESVMNGEDVKYCFDNSFNPADSNSYHRKDVFRKSDLVL